MSYLNYIRLLMVIVIINSVIIHCKNATCPLIKYKRQWGGRPSIDVDYRSIPVKYVIIHHTVTDDCDSFLTCSEIIQNIQNYHMMDLNYFDIGYNFLIGNDGVVYEGTGWLVRGSHTYGYNFNGTGIAFIGDYTAKLPSNSALAVAKKLIQCGVKNGYLDENYELYAGSQLIATKSPGLTLFNEIQEWPHWSSTP